MASVGGLWFDIGANLARLQTDMNKATRILTNFSRTANRILSVVGVGVGGAGFAMMTKQALEAGDTVMKMSQKFGISVEALQGMSYAARLADLDITELGRGMKFLSKNMYEAAAGGAEQQRVFRMIGVEYKNADGSLKSLEQVMMDSADWFAKTKDGATKAAVAVKLFGRQGLDLVPFMNMGRDALRDLLEEAKGVGYVLGEESAAKLELANDNLKRLKMTAEGVTKQFAVGLSTSLTQVTNGLIEYIKRNKDFQAVGEATGWLLKQLTLTFFALVTGGKWAANILLMLANTFAILGNKLIEFIENIPIVKKTLEEMGYSGFKRLPYIEGAAKSFEELGNQLSKNKADWDAMKKKMDEPIKPHKLRTGGQDVVVPAKMEKDLIRLLDIEYKKRLAQIEAAQKMANASQIYWQSEIEKAQEVIGYDDQRVAAAQEYINNLKAINALTDEEIRKRDTAVANAELELQKARDKVAIEKVHLEVLVKQRGAYVGFINAGKKLADEYTNYAKTMEDALVSAFHTAEDALVNFLDTGEFKFKDFCKMIQHELNRAFVKTLIGLIGGSKEQGGFGLFDVIGKLFGLPSGPGPIPGASLPFGVAKGGVFDRGKLVKYARGGLVHSPTVFPMAGGMGLMGEAGPEAVVPLKRTSSGNLGIEGGGGSGTIINIMAADAKSFEDMCKRNPQAIVGPVEKALRGNSSIRHTIKETR